LYPARGEAREIDAFDVTGARRDARLGPGQPGSGYGRAVEHGFVAQHDFTGPGSPMKAADSATLHRLPVRQTSAS